VVAALLLRKSSSTHFEFAEMLEPIVVSFVAALAIGLTTTLSPSYWLSELERAAAEMDRLECQRLRNFQFPCPNFLREWQ
jgi:hypothetical protein